MGPVFPGMDPYLEAPHFWPDVQASLSVAICNQVQPLLSPRYIATLAPYVTLESIAIAPARRRRPRRRRTRARAARPGGDGAGDRAGAADGHHRARRAHPLPAHRDPHGR